MIAKYFLTVAVLALIILGFYGITKAQAAVPWCHNFNTNLKPGTTNKNEVMALQKALIKEGFLTETSNEAVKSSYGQETTNAVIQFQTKYNIVPVSGWLWTLTRAKLNALYGCGKITVVKPNGGETWYRGETYDIKWQAPERVNKVDIFRYKYDTSGVVTGTYQIAGGIKASLGKYTWKVPKETVSDEDKNIKTAKIFIMPAGSASEVASDKSDNYFSLLDSTAPKNPLITVTSPANGDQWQQGQPYQIVWTSKDVDKDVNITIRNEDTGDVTGITFRPISVGSSPYSYTPAGLRVGDNYTIRVGYGQGDSEVAGKSAKFSIVAVPINQPSVKAPSPNSETADQQNTTLGYLGANPSGSTLPKITLLSPNGSELWQNGQKYDITFNYYNANRGKVSFVLINDSITDPSSPYKSQNIGSIYDISLSSGKFSWTISTDQYAFRPGDKYKIMAYWYANSDEGANLGSASDASNNYFSINAASVSLNESEKQILLNSMAASLANIAELLKALLAGGQ